MHISIDLVEGFFNKPLVDSGIRIAPTVQKSSVRLNRNEAAFEIDLKAKSEILKDISSVEWKKYPPPYYNDIEDLIGKHCGVTGSQIVPAAGSANLITALLNYAAINSRQVVIARPSFSLYEFHCNTYGIPFEPWYLNNDLEYDINNLPELKPFSMVLFASPNNPVGNLIKQKDLVFLLEKYPQTFFLLDEVYNDFSDTNSVPLIDKYPNLALLRSFSKSYSAAGLRIGYLIAHEDIATQVRKLILPFSLNYLSMAFVRKVLTNKKLIQQHWKNIDFVIREKIRVEAELIRLDNESDKYLLKPSHGNFILIVFNNKEIYSKAKKLLNDANIELLDLSKIPMLANAIRMTVGKTEENNAVLEQFQKL